MKKFTTYCISILFLTGFLFTNFSLKPSQDNITSKVTIEGTSTLHDWESDVKEVTGIGVAIAEKGQIKDISKLQLKFKVNSIVSGKDKMDNNTYKALEESTYPYILFNLKEVKSIKNNEISATGALTIAGVEKDIALQATGTVENQTVKIKGKYTLKMTDYNVTPPVVMFGALKTGDEVTVTFEIGIKTNQISN